MPTDLPGYYFDTKRNRYFPVSNRSGVGRGQAPASSQIKEVVQKKAHLRDQVGCSPCPSVDAGVLQLLQNREVGGNSSLGSSCNTRAFQRQYLERQTSQPRVWSYRGLTGSVDGAVERFYASIQTCEGSKEGNVLTWGGSNGFFGICEITQSKFANDSEYAPQQLLPSDKSRNGTEGPPSVLPTKSMLLSKSKVTAIKRLGRTLDAHHDGAVLTTLGSAGEGGAMFLLKQSQQQDGCWQNGQPLPLNITRSVVTDCSVWTTACSGLTNATLGTSKGAALVDLERSSLTWICRSRSDILSQQCDSSGNIVLCGFRNGIISTIDVRISSPRSRYILVSQNRRGSSPSTLRQPYPSTYEGKHKVSTSNLRPGLAGKKPVTKAADEAYSHSKPMQMKSAICSMVLLHSDETYLLASAMNGDIQLWDRRLVEKGPVLSYDGNCNTHSMLQLGVDPSEALLASGGEDCSIRIWSVRSGKHLQTISGLTSPVTTISSPIELGNNKLYAESSSSQEPYVEQDHVWEMWLGSSSELLYMHGGATG